MCSGPLRFHRCHILQKDAPGSLSKSLFNPGPSEETAVCPTLDPLHNRGVHPKGAGASPISHPERAPLIQRAFQLYGSGTESRAGALRQVTLPGLIAQTGKELTTQSVENLLRNPIYAAWVVIAAWNLKERGSFEALVSDELFERVQDIVKGNCAAVVPHNRCG